MLGGIERTDLKRMPRQFGGTFGLFVTTSNATDPSWSASPTIVGLL